MFEGDEVGGTCGVQHPPPAEVDPDKPKYEGLWKRKAREKSEAEAAGATIARPGEQTFWGGYSGYFRDPDGFYWEVAWNPQLPLGR